VPADPSLVVATADYGEPVCAAVARGNVLATQFHPEKSGSAGTGILRAFLEQR
jgi:glutamine amidotransferase